MLQPHQRIRTFTRVAFFSLFMLAPVTDLFRYDLTQGHFVLFGQVLGLGLEQALQQGDQSAAAVQILLRVLLPFIGLVAVGIWIAARYGRLYCGWLCPHFSVVELINRQMQKLLGRPTVWEKGSKPHSVSAWIALVISAALIAWIWAIGLLGYLVPPLDLYRDILNGELRGGRLIFIIAATLVLMIDFLFARHLFCKFGCALGVMQSLLWMANPKALLVNFDNQRADLCKDCNSACDAACPMRLPTRSIKRRKFTCTQCSECIQACNEVQKENPKGGLLHWNIGDKRRSADSDRMIPVLDLNNQADKRDIHE